jgi:hypothetical protein
MTSVAIAVVLINSLACTQNDGAKRVAVIEQSPNPDPSDSGSTSSIKEDFDRAGGKTKITLEDAFARIESDGLPQQKMMVGIEAANNFVPFPQKYEGENAWRIPLKPRKAMNPVSVKDCFYRGVIAIAVDGVPIVNSLNSNAVHSYRPNELDKFGGHCGCERGDEYHYHLAPTHLEAKVGKGKPIAYSLDGFPIFGFADSNGVEPKDLDEFNGRLEESGYRYYSSRTFPYVNGGMFGTVEIRAGQVYPQPRTWPVRAKEMISTNVSIHEFEYDPKKKAFSIQYLGGNNRSIEYVFKDSVSVELKTMTMRNRTEVETFQLDGRERKRDSNDVPVPVQEERNCVILRIPNGYEGSIFFILDSKAPKLTAKYGRLTIDIPENGVVKTPNLQIIGDHYSVFAEYMNGSKIRTETRKYIGESDHLRYPKLSDGGSGSKQDAQGKTVSWLGFYVGANERPGVLPAFPPGL